MANSTAKVTLRKSAKKQRVSPRPKTYYHRSVENQRSEDAYIEASKGLKGRDLENLNLAIAMADEVFTNMNAEEYLNDLSSALGRSPFTELFKGYTKKRQSSQQVIHDLLDTLLQHNVTYGIYPIEGQKAWQALLKSAREAGVRIPNLLNFQQMSNVASELIGYFGSLQSAFKAMIDPSVAEGFKNQQGSTTTHNGKQVNKASTRHRALSSARR
ncbi:hypothetical protein N5V81_13915 [Escherichia coli]|nr:hypothetical protein [Escherichia coli]